MNRKTKKTRQITSLRGRDLLSIADFSPEELSLVLATATMQKKDGFPRSLADMQLALVFEKPSLRTKVSFDAAIRQLGGCTVYLGQNEVGLGQRESIADVARTLSRYVNGIIVRTFAHKTLVELAEYASVPVVNALSDEEHPCQALADLLTIAEKKEAIHGIRIAFIGDGNNVAASLAQAVTMLGGHFSIASPKEYVLPAHVAAQVKEHADASGGSFEQVITPADAVRDADVVYTDVWVSMGQEDEKEMRAKTFEGYSVTVDLMTLAKPDAIFMHDLPAHRGEEVTDEVIDGPQSVIFDQAENRLHAQRALLHLLLGR